LATTRIDSVLVPVPFRDTVILDGGSVGVDSIVRLYDTIFITEQISGAQIRIITSPYQRRIGELSGQILGLQDSLRLLVDLDVPPRYVYVDTTIYVEVPVSSTVIKRSAWNRFLMGLRRMWWIAIAVALVILVVAYLTKKRL
jgi:hypothetical protein